MSSAICCSPNRKVVMRRVVLLFIFFFTLFSSIYTQTIIEKWKKPLRKNAGRIAELKAVMQIKDVGDDFYFKYPLNLKVAPDGSIFIMDDEQLLQFDQRGKFVRNFFKKGQGPGEMGFIRNYCFMENIIIIHNARPPKIIWFNLDGKLLKEFRIRRGRLSLELLSLYDNTYYFINPDIPKTKGQSAVEDVPQNLVSLVDGEEEIKKIASFPIKEYVVIGKQGGRAFCPLSSLFALTFQERFLFISHTQEYLIKLYDLENNQIILQFSRDYKRVKTAKGQEKKCGAMVDGKPTVLPPQKYLDDIQHLFVSGDKLWVLTSTTDKERRVLIDVFNSKGQYIDNFYLKLPESLAHKSRIYKPLVVSGDFLFTIEQDEDGTYAIKKYKIKDMN
jgi:hypothetical protein